MATASVVETQVESSPFAMSRAGEQESGLGQGAVILQFPRKQTVEEIVREWLILSARYLPHIYPGGLPRALEADIEKWAHIAGSLRHEVRATFVKKWLAEIAEYKDDLARGWTSVGRIGDPKAEAYWHQCCVWSYGEPEEGHPAWGPWLAQRAQAEALATRTP